MEYHEDIKLYYETGHGSDINSRVACRTVVDLLDHLTIENDTLPRVIVSFAHATTIQLFLTALGSHANSVRPSTDSMTDMDQRKWKSSQISPFASNLAVVRYNCPDDEHKVKFFLNQKTLMFDWCSQSGVCELDAVNEKYRSYKDADCEQYFCSDTSSKAKTVYGGVLAVAVHLILIYLY